jgi:hypothetical protein
MKKYAADNLLFLREVYPEIYKLVRNRSFDRNRYKVDQAKNGDVNVSVQVTDETYRYVYSRYNPTVEAERWAESVADQVQGRMDVLLCGFGFGYHLEAFLALYPDKRVFVYEPQLDMLLCAIEHRDIRSILDNKRIAMFGVGEESMLQIALLQEVFTKADERIVALEMPVYKQLYPEVIREYRRIIRETAAAAYLSLRTLTRFRQDWTRNKILNMAVNLRTPSIKGLQGSCKGIPAVVVGSGPSLGMEAENLRRLKNRALLIAAGTSIQAMLKHNIEPDLIVSMDPSGNNYRAFERLDLEDIPFLYIPTIHSSILNKNYNYLMHAFFTLDTPTSHMMNLSEGDPIFQSTGTVTGTAIQAALYLGCRDIVFIGQDFSFPNDQYYSDGVNHRTEEDLTHSVQKATLWVDNVQGSRNRTDYSMNVLREGIEQLIEVYSGCNYYNASRIGAVIRGTKLKTLDEWVEELRESDLGEDWFKRKMREQLTPYSDERRRQIRERVSMVQNKTVEFEELFHRLENHIIEARDNWHQNTDHRLRKWLTEFERLWSPIIDDETFKYVHAFFLQRELNYLERHWYQIMEETNLQNKAAMLIELIEPVIAGWRDLAPLIRARLNELMETPEFRSPGQPIAN